MNFSGTVGFCDRKEIPETSGIYFIFDGPSLKYIGKSINLNARLCNTSHHRFQNFMALANPAVSWLEIPIDELNGKEVELIRQYDPPLNVADSPSAVRWFKKKSGKPPLKRVPILLPDHWFNQLRQRAQKRTDSMSNICRQLVIEWLNEQDGKDKTPQPKE